MSVENGSVIPSHSRLSKHKPTYLRHFSLFHLPTSSPPFSKSLLSSTFLPLDPCFLNRSLSRRKPHNNPLSRLLWGLIFLPKNAIKTYNLVTKTRKNSAKTLKNALFPLENASERLWRSFLIPENTLFGPSPGVDPSILRPDPANNEHHRVITGRSDRLLAVFLPIYTV